MKRTVVLILFSGLFLAALSPSVTAEVFERDWKTPGDGLLTYDDVNRREWLDLTETQLFKFPGDTLEEQYQAVLVETTAGGVFDGFSPAVRDDVIALAHSAGIELSTSDFSINGPPTSNFIDLVGATIMLNSSKWSIGSLNEIENGRHVTAGAGYVPNGREMAGASFGIDAHARNDNGVWLYRQIPEPSTSLMIATLIVLFFRRRIIVT